MAVEIAKLGFCSSSSRPSPALAAIASTRRRDNHRLFRYPKLRDGGNIAGTLSVSRSALVDDREKVSFTESENVLIEALLGIQGRGRSASPQQLQAVEKAVQELEAQKGVPDPKFDDVGVDRRLLGTH